MYKRQAQDLDLAQGAVFEDALILKEVKGLENHADPGPVVAAVGPALEDGLSMEEDLAIGGFFQEVNAAEGGGFSRAGFANQGNDFRGGDIEGNVL